MPRPIPFPRRLLGLLALPALTLAAMFTAASLLPNGAPVKATPPEQTVTKDVAIISVAKNGNPFVRVPQGTTITIDVVAENKGTAEETFSVLLEDETDDRDIITVSVKLAAGARATLVLPWDTTGASYEDNAPPPDARPHSLKATATLAGDSDTSNNSASTGLNPGGAILIVKNPNPPPGQTPTPTTPEITFPDNTQIAQATFGAGLDLTKPA